MKATCKYCEQEMSTDNGCTITAFDDFPDGQVRDRIPFTGDDNCRDCNTPTGNYHHPGCCVEICPLCSGQAISCPCISSE